MKKWLLIISATVICVAAAFLYFFRITTKGVFGTTVEKPKVAVCPKCGEVSLYIENFKSIK